MLNIVSAWVATDWTGVLVQLFFAYTIILMLLDKQKPPVQTCVLTGAALIILSGGGSFNSSATAVIGVLNGLLWLILGCQRYHQANKLFD